MGDPAQRLFLNICIYRKSRRKGRREKDPEPFWTNGSRWGVARGQVDVSRPGKHDQRRQKIRQSKRTRGKTITLYTISRCQWRVMGQIQLGLWTSRSPDHLSPLKEFQCGRQSWPINLRYTDCGPYNKRDNLLRKSRDGIQNSMRLNWYINKGESFTFRRYTKKTGNQKVSE